MQLLRTALSAVPLLTLYFLAPLDGPLDISTLIGLRALRVSRSSRASPYVIHPAGIITTVSDGSSV